jgi:hypothetical protein
MRIFSTRFFILFSVLTLGLVSCSEKKEEWIVAETVAEYLPLQIGKYITYRVDSLVPNPSFNTSLETHSYQVKHVVDAAITDNEGRPSYRIYRFINNANGTGPWVSSGSYFVTPLTHQIEVIENNLRFIKLREPIREGFSWKGNSYLPNNPFESFGYNLSIDNSMANWDYTYDMFEPSTVINNQTYTDVWTVEQIDEFRGDPVMYPRDYANKVRFVEKYAKNIGLVYRQLILWEYETNTTTTPSYTGFGITMWMIDHN